LVCVVKPVTPFQTSTFDSHQRMNGAVPPLLNTPSRRGAQLKAQGLFYLLKTSISQNMNRLHISLPLKMSPN